MKKDIKVIYFKTLFMSDWFMCLKYNVKNISSMSIKIFNKKAGILFSKKIINTFESQERTRQLSIARKAPICWLILQVSATAYGSQKNRNSAEGGGSSPTTSTIIYSQVAGNLRGLQEQKAGMRSWCSDSIPGTLTWNASILTGRPNTCPNSIKVLIYLV